ncbi:putative aldolase [Actinacidiphila reveromycinica]|uniref:Putative aldolase n=1 Tax=Actinacidiphila reveromycinica TaxID=659352 RepID=A0A7U3UY48_9ACTN|nr:bifunctional 4-hydroxy-2-oxoglutarate aldolase/2-dehydro-3-deoxy-phosphogluconate aldolase [Streptomyces sp. SN-593]BBB00931.1 putative aldolase [Streptomyces sp. SN-593]
MYRWEITRAALAQRVFATIRSESYDQAAATADTLLSAGLTTLEISLTTPFALEAVTTLVREVGDDAVIGAGTVLDEVSARMAIEAGARFLLSPNLDEAVLRTGHRYGVPVFPGVATPTEAVRAMELGADALTLYPATAYTPDWVGDVRAIIPQAALLPIGGVTVSAAPDWVAAGAVAVGMGSALTDGDRATVTKRLTELLERLADTA